MKFRNYCVVIMGDTLGAQDEVIKMSETKPNVLDAKGILIATFASIAEPNELSEWFKQNNRSFLVFELDKNVSGFNITMPDIHEGLFGFLDTIDTNEMDESFSKAVELSSDTKNINTKLKSITDTLRIKNTLRESEIKNMNSDQRAELLNDLIDKGLETLSDDDKKLLPLLAK